MIFIIPTNTCFWIWCFIDDIENYKNIYKIKNRSFDKPLAIFIKDFLYIEKYMDLSKKQIDFLKNYEKPFTFLIDKDKFKDDLVLKKIEKLPNKDKYKKLAFRVVHEQIHKKLIEQNWPFFLTSANKSSQSEIKSLEKIKQVFKNDIEKYNIKIFDDGIFEIKSPYAHSEIFEFTKDGLHYIRK